MAYNTSENGMLVRLLIGKIGRLDMLHSDAANVMERKIFSIQWCFLFLDQQDERNNTSATPSTYPSTCLAFFVSSGRVHLD